MAIATCLAPLTSADRPVNSDRDAPTANVAIALSTALAAT